eukprot:COSAG01_NODE_14609_length_1433_cov_1.231634_2_plen_286_part_01
MAQRLCRAFFFGGGLRRICVQSGRKLPLPQAVGARAATTDAAATSALEPTREQLRIHALRAAIPMVGFGFMDNLVMINAGEAIDLTIGVAFGLSTLTAAGFGQIFSDIAGITCGGTVDAAVAKMNLRESGLTPAQLKMRAARLAGTAGGTPSPPRRHVCGSVIALDCGGVKAGALCCSLDATLLRASTQWVREPGCAGVFVGCLLGMSCILFMDTERAERMRKAKELDSIFQRTVLEGRQYLSADRCTLWMMSEDGSSVCTRAMATDEPPIVVPVTSGLVWAAIAS